MVKLKTDDIGDVWVNPDNIIAVFRAAIGGKPLLGKTTVVLLNSQPLTVLGTPDETVQKLEGQVLLN